MLGITKRNVGVIANESPCSCVAPRDDAQPDHAAEPPKWVPFEEKACDTSILLRRPKSVDAVGFGIRRFGVSNVKLMVQIPCLNEREQLPATFEDLPRALAGFDEIEVLVIDDGSTDGTADVALGLGVHHVVALGQHRGLAAAFMVGIDACVRLGADVIVNIDADHQYRGEDIARLVAPIVAGEADMVIGDRQTDHIRHFSPVKRALQRWGSRVVRRASGTDVADSTSGFRAFSRHAATTLVVHNRFSYTLETILHAATAGLTIANVSVQTNGETRPSRLFRTTFEYVRRNGAVIIRAYNMYWPVQTFGMIAMGLFVVGAGLVGRFLVLYLQNPNYSGHIQSLTLGVGAIVLAFLVGLMALLGDLLAANRRLSEEILRRVRTLEANASAREGTPPPAIEGLIRSEAPPWTATTARQVTMARDVG